MKVIHPFKAKKVTFRDKNLEKCRNDQNFLHLAFVFAIQMKTTFLRPQARDLAQTNGFWYILLWTIFDAQRYRHRETPSSSRPRLHAGNSHPVCGRRPPTPIMPVCLFNLGYVQWFIRVHAHWLI